MLLSTVVPTIALLAFVVPGVWLWYAFSLSVPVLLLESVKGSRALRRSFRLVRHRWWATAGTILVGLLLAGMATGMLSIVVAVPIFVGGSYLVVLVVSTIAGGLSSLVSTPFQAAIIALVYFDLRVRKEGLDIELLAERMGATGPRGPGLVPQPRWVPPQPSPWQTAPERPGEAAGDPFAPLPGRPGEVASNPLTPPPERPGEAGKRSLRPAARAAVVSARRVAVALILFAGLPLAAPAAASSAAPGQEVRELVERAAAGDDAAIQALVRVDRVDGRPFDLWAALTEAGATERQARLRALATGIGARRLGVGGLPPGHPSRHSLGRRVWRRAHDGTRPR